MTCRVEFIYIDKGARKTTRRVVTESEARRIFAQMKRGSESIPRRLTLEGMKRGACRLGDDEVSTRWDALYVRRIP